MNSSDLHFFMDWFAAIFQPQYSMSSLQRYTLSTNAKMTQRDRDPAARQVQTYCHISIMHTLKNSHKTRQQKIPWRLLFRLKILPRTFSSAWCVPTLTRSKLDPAPRQNNPRNLHDNRCAQFTFAMLVIRESMAKGIGQCRALQYLYPR